METNEERLEKIRQIKEKIEAIKEHMDYINAQAGGIFEQTIITESELEFASKSPFFEMWKTYQIKFVGALEQVEQLCKELITFEQEMELCFTIAAYYALLGNTEKMDVYSKKIDWKKWNISESSSQSVKFILHDLIAFLEARGKKL